MLVTGEPLHIPTKARDLVEGMLVPVHRLVDGVVRTVASRVVAVSRSYDLATVYWQLEDDQPGWCWSAAADTYVTVVTGGDRPPAGR
ncbi:MAG: hypothetical protein ACRDP6_29465 [Actinoallomurus sp.]